MQFKTRQYLDDKDMGEGDLKVDEDAVRWGDDSVWLYQRIVLHAICNDIETFPSPCIYCQIEDNETGMSEIRFVPTNKDDLQTIFKELSRCAALHPDEDDENGEGVEEFMDASTPIDYLKQFDDKFVEPKEAPPVNGVPGQFDEVDEDDEEE